MDWKDFEWEKPLVGQSVLVCGPLYKEPKIAKRMKEPERLQHGLLAFFIDEWSCVLVNVKWWMPLPSIPNTKSEARGARQEKTMNDSQTAKAGTSLPPTLGYPVGCVVKHCGWKIPREGCWRYGLVLAHRDDVCCLQIDFGSYTAWVNPHAMMHLIRVDNAGSHRQEEGA